ncbi:hypothetical protein D3C84_742490 [compost metagenome]
MLARVKDPLRGRWDLIASAPPATPLLSVRHEAHALWALPAYRCLILAGGLTTLSSYAIGMWNTSFLIRSHDLSLQHAGMLAGVICGVAAGIGGLFAGWLNDRLSWHTDPHRHALVRAVQFLRGLVGGTVL